jgi:HNH endonuclease
MRVERACIVCKKNFKAYDVGERALYKHCSIICSAISKRGERAPREIRSCLTCSSEFRLLKSRPEKFCSHKCQHKSLIKLDHLSEEQRLDLLRSKYERFVVKGNGCWGWNGANQKGYGCFTYMHKSMRAHRASWILHNGPIQESMHVLHKCDNPPCSKPEHLFLGSHKENMKDMRSKGLHKQYSKLTEEQVKEIKSLLASGEKVDDLSKRYGVGFSTVNDIKDGRTWKRLN